MLFQYQNVRQLNKERIKGKTHIIKLNNKEIKVNVHYKSPSKGVKQQHQSLALLKNANKTKNDRKIKELRYKNKDAQNNKYIGCFYKWKIDEKKNLNSQYQYFHKAFNEINQFRQKIKVVSKSKDSKQDRFLSKSYIIKSFISDNKQIKQQKIYVPIRKIVLFSPKKNHKKKQIENQQSKGKIGQTFHSTQKKLEQSVQRASRMNKNNGLQITPSRRSYKIEVTSSKKRKNNNNNSSSFAIYNDDSGRDYKIQKLANTLLQSNNQLKSHSQSINISL